MKNFVFLSLYVILLIISCFKNYYPKSAGNEVNIVKYNFNIYYPGKTGSNGLTIVADILLRKSKGTINLEFLFNSASEIKSVMYKSVDEWINTDYERKEENLIYLSLPVSLSSDDEITIRFEYFFPFKDTSTAIYYIDRGVRWYPLIADDLALFQMTSKVNRGFEMFSAGDIIKTGLEDDYLTYTWESKIPVFKIPLIITEQGLYKKISKKYLSGEISFYKLKPDTVSYKEIINEAFHTIQFYDSLIAPYHHQQLLFFEIPDFTGINIGTGFVTVGSDFSQQFKQGFFQGIHLSIASQWFGSGVFGKLLDNGFWFFSLSLPHYLRLMYIEHSQGTDEFNNDLINTYRMYEEIAGSDNDFPILLIDMIDTKEKGLVIRGKGTYLLNLLRNQMNGKNWVTFLQELYKNYCGKILTYAEFIEELSKVSREVRLDLTFEKMITGKGVLQETD